MNKVELLKYIVERISAGTNPFSYQEIIEYENKIIETGDAYYIYFFARNVKGANISKLEDAIIEINDVRGMITFASIVAGANIERFTNIIIGMNNPEYIFLFARDVNDADISKLEDAIIEINDAKWMIIFARYIPGANIERLADSIIATNNAENIYNFALHVLVPFISSEEIEGTIENIKITKAYSLYFKLEEAIVKTQDSNFILKFRENVKELFTQKNSLKVEAFTYIKK